MDCWSDCSRRSAARPARLAHRGLVVPREYCPKCRKVTEATATMSEREETRADGSVLSVKIRTVHCESCGTFIRSEEIEED